MRRSGCACLPLLGVLAAGCGGDALAPEPAAPQPPPIVEAMFPEPRSVGVFYGTPIWVRFREPLDPATVNPQTVFLKVDTRRIDVDVAWDSAGRRILIALRDDLDIHTTHTVRLSTALRTAAGAPLEHEFFWQFRTMSVRHPLAVAPAAGAGGKGPWTSLLWRGTESRAGDVRYRVYAGSDSVEVARRGTPLGISRLPEHRAPAPWPLGAEVYWTVSTDNLTTGESVDGPVARFTTLEAGTPIDSLEIPPSEWGFFYQLQPNNHPCYGFLVSGPRYTCALRYEVSSIPADLELEGACIDMLTPPPFWSTLEVSGIFAWPATGEWSACTIAPDHPAADPSFGPLARATVLTGGRVRFDSPGMASHVQLALVGRKPIEVSLLSTRVVNYTGEVSWDVPASVRVRYYRPPAPGAGSPSLRSFAPAAHPRSARFAPDRAAARPRSLRASATGP